MLKVAMAGAEEIAPMTREEMAEMGEIALPMKEAMEVTEVTVNMAREAMVVMAATGLQEVVVVDLGEQDLEVTAKMEKMEIQHNQDLII
jgi:hypothetical protein